MWGGGVRGKCLSHCSQLPLVFFSLLSLAPWGKKPSSLDDVYVHVRGHAGGKCGVWGVGMACGACACMCAVTHVLEGHLYGSAVGAHTGPSAVLSPAAGGGEGHKGLRGSWCNPRPKYNYKHHFQVTSGMSGWQTNLWTKTQKD